MALLGTGALAMWWEMAAAMRAEFEDWHSHEHFPERMGIPGFLRGTRWTSTSGDDGVFVLYEVESHATLSSAPYVAHLNAPTPWSTKMMPHHRNMVRSQCVVVHSRGGAVARHAVTVRFGPPQGERDELHAYVSGLARGTLAAQPGLVGAHLLQHRAPALAPTTEQKIRSGADRIAESVLVVCGYEPAALTGVVDALARAGTGHGGAPRYVVGTYSLSCSATPGDVV